MAEIDKLSQPARELLALAATFCDQLETKVPFELLTPELYRNSLMMAFCDGGKQAIIRLERFMKEENGNAQTEG